METEVRKIHVMCDLETLGKAPGCKIVSIGAVEFSSAGLGHEFYMEVTRDFQGTLNEDPSTLEWWAAQPSEVRDRLFEHDARRPFLSSALFDFNEWLVSLSTQSQGGPAEIALWGNGATFDNSILRYAYTAVGGPKEPAWPWFNDFCYRTLKNLRLDVQLERTSPKHHALCDAKYQALHAIELMKAIGVWV